MNGGQELFQDSSSQLEEFHSRLEVVFSPAHIDVFWAWVEQQAKDYTDTLYEPLGRRVEKFNNTKSAPENESKEQKKTRKRKLFEAMDPKGIASALDTASKGSSIVTDYLRWADGVSDLPAPTGKIASRYVVPRHVAEALTCHALSPIRTTGSNLRKHVEALKKLSAKYKALAATAGIKKGAAIAATVAASLVAGRLGALGARGAMAGLFSADRATAKQEMAVLETFSGVANPAWSVFHDVLPERVTLLLASLYGGLLLRTQEDLALFGAGVGYPLRLLTGQLAEFAPSLSLADREQLQDWCLRHAEHTDALLARGDSAQVADVATGALTVLSDPRRASVVDGSGKSYVLHFSFRLAQAMMDLAEPLWEQGRIAECLAVYAALFRTLGADPSVFYVPEEEGAERPPGPISGLISRIAFADANFPDVPAEQRDAAVDAASCFCERTQRKEGQRGLLQGERLLHADAGIYRFFTEVYSPQIRRSVAVDVGLGKRGTEGLVKDGGLFISQMSDWAAPHALSTAWRIFAAVDRGKRRITRRWLLRWCTRLALAAAVIVGSILGYRALTAPPTLSERAAEWAPDSAESREAVFHLMGMLPMGDQAAFVQRRPSDASISEPTASQRVPIEDGRITVIGHTNGSALVRIGGEEYSVHGGQFSLRVPVDLGRQNLEVEFFENSRYPRFETLRFTVIPPYVPLVIESPSSQRIRTSDRRITFSGQVPENAEVELNGERVRVRRGEFSERVRLERGDNRFMLSIEAEGYTAIERQFDVFRYR